MVPAWCSPSRCAIDGDYMFTVDAVGANNTGARRCGCVPSPGAARLPAADRRLLHPARGSARRARRQAQDDPSYDDVKTEAEKHRRHRPAEQSTGGWTGITDKYWLTAVIPDQDVPVTATFRSRSSATGPDRYQADYTRRAADDGGPGAPAQTRPRVRRRQGGASARPLRGAGPCAAVLLRGGLRLVLVPDQADLLRAGLAECRARQFRPRHHGVHRIRQAAVLPASQQILPLDEQDEAARARR